MKDIVRAIYRLARDDDAYGEKFFISLAIAIVVFISIKLFGKFVKKFTQDEKLRYKINRSFSFIVFLLGAAGILYTWFNALNGLMAAVTILIALAVFSLRDLILNIAGFGYLNLKRPIYMGDRIEIKGHLGDVVDIDLFHFSIAEVGNWLSTQGHTGRVIYFPNQDIFSEPVANFTNNFPYIWRDIILPITHKSNVERATEILEEIGNELLFELIERDQLDPVNRQKLLKLGDRIQLFDGSILPKVYIKTDGNGIDLILKFLSPATSGSDLETIIWKRLINVVNYYEDLEFSPRALRVINSLPTNEYQ